MEAQRRVGGKDSATRWKLVDAAERLMVDDGYAAVTSRRVGKEAGIAPQLVHYYFRTMDELFLEVIRRRSEVGLEEFARAIEGEVSLRMLWELQLGASENQVDIELAALGKHRKAVRAEIAKYGDRFRKIHAEAVTRALERQGISPDLCPPGVVTLMMTGVAQILGLEHTVGMAADHEETKAFVDQLITRLEREGQRSNG